MKYFAVILLLIIIVVPATTRDTPAKSISLAQLLSTPEKFDGSKVMLLGYLHIDLDGSELFFHETDFLNDLETNSIGVHPSSEMMGIVSKLNHKYVLLEGVFHYTHQDVLSFRSGMIDQISRVEVWSSPDNPREMGHEKLRKMYVPTPDGNVGTPSKK